MKPEKTEPTPEERARQLLEQGISTREAARITGLGVGPVKRLRSELAGEWRALGRELPTARPGPARVTVSVSVPSRAARDLDERAAAEGLTREELVLRLLGLEGIAGE